MSFDPQGYVVNPSNFSTVMKEIKRLTEEGLSGRAILRDFRARHIEVRDNIFWSLRRDVLNLRKYQEQLSRLTDARIVPRSWHYNSENWQLSRKYLYIFDVTLYNPTTGDYLYKQGGAIATDEFLTVGKMKSDKIKQMESGSETTKWKVVEITLLQAISR